MVSEIISEMITFFNGDARRINHALKVYGFAKAIMGSESLSDNERLIVELAAVLHDIGIKEAEHKYNSSAGKYQEMESPPIAGGILKEHGVERDTIDRICYIIGNHHSYTKIDNIDFQILVEADFIVNIFEDNMDKNEVKIIMDKYFKTLSGKRILESIYKPS